MKLVYAITLLSLNSSAFLFVVGKERGEACTNHSECEGGKCKGHRGQGMQCRTRSVDCKGAGYHNFERQWRCPSGMACTATALAGTNHDDKWGDCTAAPTASPTTAPTKAPTAKPTSKPTSPLPLGFEEITPKGRCIDSNGHGSYYDNLTWGYVTASQCEKLCLNSGFSRFTDIIGWEHGYWTCYCMLKNGLVTSRNPGQGGCPAIPDVSFDASIEYWKIQTQLCDGVNKGEGPVNRSNGDPPYQCNKNLDFTG